MSKSPNNSIGLGDVVETITRFTGIKAIVDSYSKKTGKKCGCQSRKQKLNKIQLPRIN